MIINCFLQTLPDNFNNYHRNYGSLKNDLIVPGKGTAFTKCAEIGKNLKEQPACGDKNNW